MGRSLDPCTSWISACIRASCSRLTGRRSCWTERSSGAIYKPRPPFAHKGNFGHALLVAGSYGKMGAAVLGCEGLSAERRRLAERVTSRAAGIRSCRRRCRRRWSWRMRMSGSTRPSREIVGVLGGGSWAGYRDGGADGGISAGSAGAEYEADGAGCRCAEYHLFVGELWALVPAYSILTPHPKEFERLFGPSADDYARVEKAREEAKARQCIIVLKGHYTFIAMPGGKGYFNSTGNAGMAKGGSGDVLDGHPDGDAFAGVFAGRSGVAGGIFAWVGGRSGGIDLVAGEHAGVGS